MYKKKGHNMKKILLTLTLLAGGIGVCIASIDATYSDGYIKNFKNCTPYSEIYNVEIPTDDPNTPVLHIRSNEQIKGVKDGKCVTNSTAYSEELKQDIIIVSCSFSKEQVNNLADKMSKATSDNNVREQLQNEMADYVKNHPEVCQTQNLLKNN